MVCDTWEAEIERLRIEASPASEKVRGTLPENKRTEDTA
jgi:hypothetical protein